MNRIKTAIVGASGYTGMELLRLLLVHPGVELTAATSRQEAGKTLAEVFPRFGGAPGAGLRFIEPDPDGISATGAKVAYMPLTRPTRQAERQKALRSKTKAKTTAAATMNNAR